jgi:hypothetical protein
MLVGARRRSVDLDLTGAFRFDRSQRILFASAVLLKRVGKA